MSMAPERIALNPLAVGLLSAAMTMAPLNNDGQNYPNSFSLNPADNSHTLVLNNDQIPHYNQQLFRQPDQLFGTFAYGHREREMIMEKGDIADGFLPINGIEYTEEDVSLVYEQLKQFKYANIDFVVYSWHSIDDVRDKYMKFILDVMNKPDNPHPNLKITEIYELDSNISRIDKEQLYRDLQYLKDNYFSNPHFLKDEDEKPIIFVFSQYLEGILDNPSHVRDWLDAANDFNFTPILEAYFGDTLNPDHDELMWYQYADEIWDLFPTGLHITDDVARVNVAYSKPGDFKNIPFDKEKFKKNLVKAIRSGKMVVVVSWNEYYENTNAEGNPEAIETMHDIFPTQIYNPVFVSGDQYIYGIQLEIDGKKLETPAPIIPPIKPKENLIFIINERQRKKIEEELEQVA